MSRCQSAISDTTVIVFEKNNCWYHHMREHYNHLYERKLRAFNNQWQYHGQIHETCNPQREFDCTSQCAHEHRRRARQGPLHLRREKQLRYIEFLVECYTARLAMYLWHEARTVQTNETKEHHADQILLLEMLLREAVAQVAPHDVSPTAAILLTYPFSEYLLRTPRYSRIARVLSALNLEHRGYRG